MTDLVAWLREQIAETERRENSKCTLGWETGDPCPICQRPTVSIMVGQKWNEEAEVQPCGHILTGEQRDQLLKWTPAPDPEVLAQCEAHRRILDALWFASSVTEVYDEQGNVIAGGADAVNSVVQLVALAYQHHPGYREEWRP